MQFATYVQDPQALCSCAVRKTNSTSEITLSSFRYLLAVNLTEVMEWLSSICYNTIQMYKLISFGQNRISEII
jgi:hypothetical protein